MMRFTLVIAASILALAVAYHGQQDQHNFISARDDAAIDQTQFQGVDADAEVDAEARTAQEICTTLILNQVIADIEADTHAVPVNGRGGARCADAAILAAAVMPAIPPANTPVMIGGAAAGAINCIGITTASYQEVLPALTQCFRADQAAQCCSTSLGGVHTACRASAAIPNPPAGQGNPVLRALGGGQGHSGVTPMLSENGAIFLKELLDFELEMLPNFADSVASDFIRSRPAAPAPAIVAGVAHCDAFAVPPVKPVLPLWLKLVKITIDGTTRTFMFTDNLLPPATTLAAAGPPAVPARLIPGTQFAVTAIAPATFDMKGTLKNRDGPGLEVGFLTNHRVIYTTPAVCSAIHTNLKAATNQLAHEAEAIDYSMLVTQFCLDPAELQLLPYVFARRIFAAVANNGCVGPETLHYSFGVIDIFNQLGANYPSTGKRVVMSIVESLASKLTKLGDKIPNIFPAKFAIRMQSFFRQICPMVATVAEAPGAGAGNEVWVGTKATVVNALNAAVGGAYAIRVPEFPVEGGDEPYDLFVTASELSGVCTNAAYRILSYKPAGGVVTHHWVCESWLIPAGAVGVHGASTWPDRLLPLALNRQANVLAAVTVMAAA